MWYYSLLITSHYPPLCKIVKPFEEEQRCLALSGRLLQILSEKTNLRLLCFWGNPSGQSCYKHSEVRAWWSITQIDSKLGTQSVGFSEAFQPSWHVNSKASKICKECDTKYVPMFFQYLYNSIDEKVQKFMLNGFWALYVPCLGPRMEQLPCEPAVAMKLAGLFYGSSSHDTAMITWAEWVRGGPKSAARTFGRPGPDRFFRDRFSAEKADI